MQRVRADPLRTTLPLNSHIYIEQLNCFQQLWPESQNSLESAPLNKISGSSFAFVTAWSPPWHSLSEEMLLWHFSLDCFCPCLYSILQSTRQNIYSWLAIVGRIAGAIGGCISTAAMSQLCHFQVNYHIYADTYMYNLASLSGRCQSRLSLRKTASDLDYI